MSSGMGRNVNQCYVAWTIRWRRRRVTTITQLQRLHRTIQGIQLRKTVHSNLIVAPGIVCDNKIVQSNTNVVLGIVCDNNTFQNNLNIVHGVLCDNTIKYSGCVGLGSKTIYFFRSVPMCH